MAHQWLLSHGKKSLHAELKYSKVNLKRCTRKKVVFNLRIYLAICLQGLRRNTECCGQNSWYLGPDLKLVSQEYEAEMTHVDSRRSSCEHSRT
jgi:hypothetical protein